LSTSVAQALSIARCAGVGSACQGVLFGGSLGGDGIQGVAPGVAGDLGIPLGSRAMLVEGCSNGAGELEQTANRQPNLAILHMGWHERPAPIGPLQGKPNKQALGMLDVNVPTTVRRAHCTGNRQPESLERVGGQRHRDVVRRWRYFGCSL
jgi:hypothetical protein